MVLLNSEISLHSLQGDYDPRTLRITRYYKKDLLEVLIDNGSSYNFMRVSVARRLKLKVELVDYSVR